MISKLKIEQVVHGGGGYTYASTKIAEKVNEIIDSLSNRKLICSHCGGDEWYEPESRESDRGVTYTYKCIKCGKCTQVVQYGIKKDCYVYLEPDDLVLGDLNDT